MPFVTGVIAKGVRGMVLLRELLLVSQPLGDDFFTAASNVLVNTLKRPGWLRFFFLSQMQFRLAVVLEITWAYQPCGCW